MTFFVPLVEHESRRCSKYGVGQRVVVAGCVVATVVAGKLSKTTAVFGPQADGLGTGTLCVLFLATLRVLCEVCFISPSL